MDLPACFGQLSVRCGTAQDYNSKHLVTRGIAKKRISLVRQKYVCRFYSEIYVLVFVLSWSCWRSVKWRLWILMRKRRGWRRWCSTAILCRASQTASVVIAVYLTGVRRVGDSVLVNQILEGPFSVVSKPSFASEGSVSRIFDIYKIDTFLTAPNSKMSWQWMLIAEFLYWLQVSFCRVSVNVSEFAKFIQIS